MEYFSIKFNDLLTFENISQLVMILSFLFFLNKKLDKSRLLKSTVGIMIGLKIYFFIIINADFNYFIDSTKVILSQQLINSYFLQGISLLSFIFFMFIFLCLFVQHKCESEPHGNVWLYILSPVKRKYTSNIFNSYFNSFLLFPIQQKKCLFKYLYCFVSDFCNN